MYKNVNNKLPSSYLINIQKNFFYTFKRKISTFYKCLKHLIT